MSSTNFLSLVHFIGIIIIIVIISIVLIVFIIQREKTKRTKISASVLEQKWIKKLLKKELKDNYTDENGTNIINIAKKLSEIKK